MEDLIITGMLKKFNDISLGQQIMVCTNHSSLGHAILGIDSNQEMTSRLLLEEYAPEIMYILGVTKNMAESISRDDMDATHMVSEENLKNHDDEKEHVQGKHVHLSRVLSQLLQNYTDLGTGIGECSANIFMEVEDASFSRMAGIAHEQKVDATLKY